MYLRVKEGVIIMDKQRNTEVQRKLKYLLSQKILTMAKIAEDLDVNYSNLSKFKNNWMLFSDDYLDTLEPYLDMWLVFEELITEYIRDIKK